MSSINPSFRPLGPDEEDICRAEPEPASSDPEASPLSSDPAWQARLEGVNRGPGQPTALERHVHFFDANKDDVISVGEVRRGLEKIGMESWVERVFASTLNNALLAPPTRDRLISFSIDVKNLEKARHEGDTGIFDPEGKFVPAKFEEMFAKNDKDLDGRLSATEIRDMVAKNVEGVSPRGRGKFSAEAEFDLLLKLCAYEDKKGERYVTKERMLSFYDGSLFDTLAAEVSAKGKIDRAPAHDDKANGASGPLPGLARRSAGPAAGPAASASYGAQLLTSEDPAQAGAANAVLGGMLAVCPYAGAQTGGAGQR